MKKIILTTTAVLSLLATGATISSVNASSGPAPQTNSQSDTIIATDVTLVEQKEAKIKNNLVFLSSETLGIDLVDENYRSNFKNQFPNFFKGLPGKQVRIDGKRVEFKVTKFGTYSINFESKDVQYKATVDVRENVRKGYPYYVYLTKLEVLSTNQTSGNTTTTTTTPVISPTTTTSEVRTTPASSPATPTPTPTETNRWVQAGSRWWYKHVDGSYQTNGWEKINGVWYRFDNSGWMKTGWVKTGSSWYYLNNSGSMATGWVKDNGTWYYLNKSGTMATGWVKDNGSWYYLDQSGSMKTGWFTVSGKWYYAYSSGALAVNTTTPDGYEVNANGEWVG